MGRESSKHIGVSRSTLEKVDDLSRRVDDAVLTILQGKNSLTPSQKGALLSFARMPDAGLPLIHLENFGDPKKLKMLILKNSFFPLPADTPKTIYYS